jgi:hypothetical protein
MDWHFENIVSYDDKPEETCDIHMCDIFYNVMLSFQELTSAIVTSLPIAKQDQPPDLLGPIIKPFTELIIQIDKKVFFNP